MSRVPRSGKFSRIGIYTKSAGSRFIERLKEKPRAPTDVEDKAATKVRVLLNLADSIVGEQSVVVRCIVLFLSKRPKQMNGSTNIGFEGRPLRHLRLSA